jgi:hypothetical protein
VSVSAALGVDFGRSTLSDPETSIVARTGPRI